MHMPLEFILIAAGVATVQSMSLYSLDFLSLFDWGVAIIMTNIVHRKRIIPIWTHKSSLIVLLFICLFIKLYKEIINRIITNTLYIIIPRVVELTNLLVLLTT